MSRLAALFGRADAPVAVPEGFDWKFYLDYYPDLRSAGLQTEQDAADHYLFHGFFERRLTCAPEQDMVRWYEDARRRQLDAIAAFDERDVRIVKREAGAAPVTVSVVITLYNYEQYIEACVRSVLNSTLRDFEIIIVNDASTDSSLARCSAFLSCGMPLTIIDKTVNTGVSHCRNQGIRHARGDCVFILDADNEIYPACLAEHVACMRADPERVACYGVIDVFDGTGRFCGQVSCDPFDFGHLLRGNYIDAMAMFDRRALIGIGMYDEKLLEQGIGYEDYELWLRIGRQGSKVGFIERPLSRYLKKDKSMLAVADRYYHRSLMAGIRHTYAPHGAPVRRTAVLVVGMHRSGTSALAGLLSLMGAYPGADLIGPNSSNTKGHFEPRKIVAVNDALLEALGARAPESGDLPAGWLERPETRRARETLENIILDDYRGREIFVIKDPRLCLLLPLYREIFSGLGIDVRIVVIQRDMREVIRSLHERDGLPRGSGRAYYAKHISAIERNLAGLESVTVTFDQLTETPRVVIEKIRAFIPGLPADDSRDMERQAGHFIEPGLRHHRVRSARSFLPRMIARGVRRISGRAGEPDFLIIGAQRAGTTALYQYLCAHPQIHAPACKELHWFHAGPKDGDGYHKGHRTRQWYERQLVGRGKAAYERLLHRDRLLFEATPEYLYHPRVPHKVFQLYPAVKLIVVLRDPLDRAVSQYYHEKNAGFISPDLSIEEYFARDRKIASIEEQKLMHDDGYFSYSYEHCCPVARSNYGRQLTRWLHCFNRDQMLILRSDDLFHDPGPVLDRVCGFLAIAPGVISRQHMPAARNSSSRPPLSPGQREKLSAFFPFDMSLDTFCGPPVVGMPAEPSRAAGCP